MHYDVKYLAIMALYLAIGLSLLQCMLLALRSKHMDRNDSWAQRFLFVVLCAFLGLPGCILTLVGSVAFTLQLMLIIYKALI